MSVINRKEQRRSVTIRRLLYPYMVKNEGAILMKNPEVRNFSASVKMGKAVVGTPVAASGRDTRALRPRLTSIKRGLRTGRSRTHTGLVAAITLLERRLVGR
jgi:hypothetical protein